MAFPVAVFNNKKGKDAQVLRSFGEPAWNNSVVRIITHDRKELASRVSGNYSTYGLLEAMTDALEKAGHNVPGYLRLLEFEERADAKGF